MANPRNACIGYRNLADTAMIIGTNAIPLAPASLLQNIHIARKTRSAGYAEAYVIDLGSIQSIDTIWLLGVNLSLTGTSYIRISATDPTGAAGEIYSSGSVGGRVNPVFKALPIIISAPVSGRYVRIDLSDITLPYIESGRLFIGLRHQFEYNFTPGWSRSRVDRSRNTESRGGQIHSDIDNNYRILSATFDQLSEAETDIIDEIDQVHGTHGDILFITDPTSSNLARDSIFGMIQEIQPIIQPQITDPAAFSRTFNIRERL